MASTPYGSAPATDLTTVGRGSQSAFALLRRLADELGTLLRQELALAAVEFFHSMRLMLAGAASLAVGGVVVFAGCLALLAAAVLGLATVLHPWLAALVIGAAVTLIGAVLITIGFRSLDPSTLKPSRTAESLRRDRDIITRRQP